MRGLDCAPTSIDISVSRGTAETSFCRPAASLDDTCGLHGKFFATTLSRILDEESAQNRSHALRKYVALGKVSEGKARDVYGSDSLLFA